MATIVKAKNIKKNKRYNIKALPCLARKKPSIPVIMDSIKKMNINIMLKPNIIAIY